MNWRCLWLPWHKLRVEKKYSSTVYKMRCSCGRRYGVHTEQKCVLPWDAELKEVSESLLEDKR